MAADYPEGGAVQSLLDFFSTCTTAVRGMSCQQFRPAHEDVLISPPASNQSFLCMQMIYVRVRVSQKKRLKKPPPDVKHSNQFNLVTVKEMLKMTIEDLVNKFIIFFLPLNINQLTESFSRDSTFRQLTPRLTTEPTC